MTSTDANPKLVADLVVPSSPDKSIDPQRSWGSEIAYGWAIALWWMTTRLWLRLEGEDVYEGKCDAAVVECWEKLPKGTPKYGLAPIGDGLAPIVEYVYGTIVRPLFLRPPAALFCAIESELLHTKLFCRATLLLKPGVLIATKVFAFHRSHDGEAGSTARPFYALIYEMILPEEARTPAALRNHLNLMRGAFHIYCDLHLNLPLDDVNATRDTLKSWLVHTYGNLDLSPKVEVEVPPPGFDPEKSEAEATLRALLAIVATGYAGARPKSDVDVAAIRKNYPTLNDDLDEFTSRIREFNDKNPRARSVQDIEWVEEHSPTGDLYDRRLDQLDTAAILRETDRLAESAREQPLAWICQAVADRFVELSPKRNVLVRIRPAPRDRELEPDEVFLEVTRELDFTSVLPKKIDDNKPHLLRYTIRYPRQWTDLNDPDRRRILYRWLGVIDLIERPNEVNRTDKERDEALADLRRSEIHWIDYKNNPEARDDVERYALALEYLDGDPVPNEYYSIRQIEAMLAGSCLSLSGILEHDELRSFVLSRLRFEPDWGLLDDEQIRPELRAWLLTSFVCECDVEDERRLAGFIADQLSLPAETLDQSWRDALLFTAAELDEIPPKEEERILSGVFDHAQRIHDDQKSETQNSLLIAIRSYAYLVPEDDADTLAGFVSTSDARASIATLLGLHNIFINHPPRAQTCTAKLNKAIAAILHKYLDAEILAGPMNGNATLALSAFKAATVLGHESLEQFTKKTVDLGLDWFAEQVRDDALRPTLTLWDSIADSNQVPEEERERFSQAHEVVRASLALFDEEG